MFLVDSPYISDFLRHTLKDNAIPVIATPAAASMNLLPGTRMVEPDTAIRQICSAAENAADSIPPLQLYTTSENALDWVVSNLGATGLPAAISAFKDKYLFRQRTQPLFPDFFYAAVEYTRLEQFDVNQCRFPFIIKPSIGFFSMGVHRVDTPEDWPRVCSAIQAELAYKRQIYPQTVLDMATFIVEECIEGEEFAVDAYYTADSEAVIVGIHKHMFASAADVSDRVYITSKEIIQQNLERFSAFATAVGKQLGVRNFPVHMELRCQADAILPIEVNPMRFGGWCSTADSTAGAFDFNPYVSYYTGIRPDWEEILHRKDDSIHSIVVLDNSTGIDPARIQDFNYTQLLNLFESPIELRRTDVHTYNVFGFLFSATRADNISELEHILQSDLREFVTYV